MALHENFINHLVSTRFFDFNNNPNYPWMKRLDCAYKYGRVEKTNLPLVLYYNFEQKTCYVEFQGAVYHSNNSNIEPDVRLILGSFNKKKYEVKSGTKFTLYRDLIRNWTHHTINPDAWEKQIVSNLPSLSYKMLDEQTLRKFVANIHPDDLPHLMAITPRTECPEDAPEVRWIGKVNSRSGKPQFNFRIDGVQHRINPRDFLYIYLRGDIGGVDENPRTVQWENKLCISPFHSCPCLNKSGRPRKKRCLGKITREQAKKECDEFQKLLNSIKK